jgi:hypothetical protein
MHSRVRDRPRGPSGSWSRCGGARQNGPEEERLEEIALRFAQSPSFAGTRVKDDPGLDGKRAAFRGIASFDETITDARIFRVPVKGGPPEVLLTLPFDEVDSIAMFPDGRRFVASVYSSRSDVWAVDNFDVTSVGPRAGSRSASGR